MAPWFEPPLLSCCCLGNGGILPSLGDTYPMHTLTTPPTQVLNSKTHAYLDLPLNVYNYSSGQGTMDSLVHTASNRLRVFCWCYGPLNA